MVSRSGFKTPAFWVVVLLVVSCFSLTAFGLKRIEGVAEDNTRVLCNLRGGYEEQRARSMTYLDDPVKMAQLERIGFTRADVKQQISSLTLRIRDLEGVEC